MENPSSVVLRLLSQRANASIVGGVSQVNPKNLLDCTRSRLGCILLHCPGARPQHFVVFPRNAHPWRNLQGGRGECSSIPQHFAIFNDKVLATAEPAALVTGRPAPALCHSLGPDVEDVSPLGNAGLWRPQHFVTFSKICQFLDGKFWTQNDPNEQLFSNFFVHHFLPGRK